MFGPVTNTGVITTVNANIIKGPDTSSLGETVSSTMESYTAAVTPSTTPVGTDPVPVTQSWTLGDNF